MESDGRKKKALVFQQCAVKQSATETHARAHTPTGGGPRPDIYFKYLSCSQERRRKVNGHFTG